MTQEELRELILVEINKGIEKAREAGVEAYPCLWVEIIDAAQEKEEGR